VTLTLIYIAIAAVLVLLNGFFVLVEFAIVKARRTRLEMLKAEGVDGARLAIEMQKHINDYLSVCQLGITVASLGLGWIGEPAFARIFDSLLRLPGIWSDVTSHTASFVAAFALITFLHILIGELTPKQIAIVKAEESAIMSAAPMRFFYYIFYVPMVVLNGGANLILRILRLPTSTAEGLAMSDEELRIILSHSHREGEMTLDEVLLCENVLDLSELTVCSIMVPIDRVAMLNLKAPWEENLAVIKVKKFSRFPVYDGDRSKILGKVHVKDLGLAAMSGQMPEDLSKFLREPPMVDESMSVETLLRHLQKMPTNMAFVVDKAGTVKGIVTLEDVLEELVGEINDEFEREAPWRLGDCMHADAVLLDFEVDDKAGAVKALSQVMARQMHGVDAARIEKKVMAREAQGSTGLGRGIAVPHGRIEGLKRTHVAYGRPNAGVEFNSPDELPVRHIFMILTPMESPMEQVKALARIAAMASSDMLMHKLSDARAPDEIVGIVKGADVSGTLDSQPPQEPLRACSGPAQ
jgi:CBS domain containing-hemolysin-like protein/mannitol/fructose-specific phosphotransferase system IIA component (Ntr-type)